MRRQIGQPRVDLFNAVEAITLVIKGHSLTDIANKFAMPVESLIEKLEKAEEFIDLTE